MGGFDETGSFFLFPIVRAQLLTVDHFSFFAIPHFSFYSYSLTDQTGGPPYIITRVALFDRSNKGVSYYYHEGSILHGRVSRSPIFISIS